MRTQLFVCVLPALLACTLLPASAMPMFDDAARTKIDKVVEGSIAKHDTPSCVVVIGTKDKVLFAKAYGHFTYDVSSPLVTADTPYDMASCSKAVGTATATALLLQDGKLKLEDPVSKYLPSWDRDDKRTITVRNLVTHTSGLAAYTSAANAENVRTKDETHADGLISYIALLPLKYETNKGQLYACLNFLTLARVNEQAAGVSQETLLRRRVFRPLGMVRSGYYLSEAKKALSPPTSLAADSQGNVHDPLANYYRDGYHCPGNAGLFTTGNDAAKLCQMILSDGKWEGKQVFTPATVDMLFTNQILDQPKESWGLGWGISRNRPYPASVEIGPKTVTISHSGYTGTSVEIDRYAGTFMVILTNRVYPDDSTNVGPLRGAVRQAVIDADPVYKHAILSRNGH
jgi:beta-N-acetylhexosaminidase